MKKPIKNPYSLIWYDKKLTDSQIRKNNDNFWKFENEIWKLFK